METGERIDFSQPAARGGLGDVVVGSVHRADTDTPAQPAASSSWPKPQPESAVKISNLITRLETIKAEHGDLTCAEEGPLGFFAIRYMETAPVPRSRAVLGVIDGETVVLIRGSSPCRNHQP
jgi:hypothetical protein